jgi:hypothetical protein
MFEKYEIKFRELFEEYKNVCKCKCKCSVFPDICHVIMPEHYMSETGV